jgi:hypothetical protein
MQVRQREAHHYVGCVLFTQALAKIAVRSGEPFRVQAYQILAAAAGGSVAHRNRSSSRGGTNLAPAAVAGKPAAVAAKAAAASAAAESAAGDPLGVAAVVGPALEVLDHMYASKHKAVTDSERVSLTSLVVTLSVLHVSSSSWGPCWLRMLPGLW